MSDSYRDDLRAQVDNLAYRVAKLEETPRESQPSRWTRFWGWVSKTQYPIGVIAALVMLVTGVIFGTQQCNENRARDCANACHALQLDFVAVDEQRCTCGGNGRLVFCRRGENGEGCVTSRPDR